MALLVRERCRKAQCRNTEAMDQFWNLPDPIIHHNIFSFLEMDDIARIGVVSKRFRQMFVSSPYLKFVSKCLYQNVSMMVPRIRAINLLIVRMGC
jgi:hypothetical protein